VKVISLKVAIVGGGIAGSFLASLLNNEKVDVTVFTDSKRLGCFCAWGTVFHEVDRLLRRVGLKLKNYVYAKIRDLVVNGVRFNAQNLVTFNKPKLIYDLLENVNVKYANIRKPPSNYDIIVDATGFRRTLLGKLRRDFLLSTVEYVVKDSEGVLDERTIYVQLGRVGYAWMFPLENGFWHVGAGDKVLDVEKLIKKVMTRYGLAKSRFLITCKCRSYVRLLPPKLCQPIVRNNVYGCGESVGTVFPLTGEGIAFSMRCSEILFENLIQNNEPSNYVRSLLKEFEWFNSAYRLVLSLSKSNVKILFNAFIALRTILKYARRLGAGISDLSGVFKVIYKLLK